MTRILRTAMLVLALAWSSRAGESPEAAGASKRIQIAIDPQASVAEQLAAREVRRYLFMRTGQLLPITISESSPLAISSVIAIGNKNRAMVKAMLADGTESATLAGLGSQQYWLKSIESLGRRSLLLTGGDDAGALYAAYRLAEHFGIRFYLHGDVMPEEAIPLEIPSLDETARPLFELRGIQPFHDFPEGPDWWNLEDYQSILAQLPKLRMNFFGLHTYPEGGPNAEPTVWIGLAGDIEAGGKVRFSYPASYQNTLRGNWGYQSKKTEDFSFGASALFERDDHGSEVMRDYCPEPPTLEGGNMVFQRAGELLRQAFVLARQLGIKTCVGTETPLTIPKRLQGHLMRQDLNPTNAETVLALYEGIFERIKQTYPIDYYWFWTPEGWTWEGVKESQVQATIHDIKLALEAASRVKAPFQLATCGWVLGPPFDRALFDQALPKEMPLSCINREVGKSPVEPGFAQVKDRPKWAIPWLEDDPALTSPQLWVGRMRQDAKDALDYGCTGLMGIHWRTRSLGPNVSALAQAAWRQTPWRQTPERQSGWVGGASAHFPSNPIDGTDLDPIYQSVLYNMSQGRLALPNGQYRVTLQFCEPHYHEAGKRIFGVKLQDKTVLEQLDIFAKVGRNQALDYSYERVVVTNGWLTLQFVPQVEFPSMAGLVIQGKQIQMKINCGGPAYRDYLADLPQMPRYQPTRDFYEDWARVEFGPAVSQAAARIFERIDGRLPRPSDWVEGPGGLKPDPRPWSEVEAEYGFVDELKHLMPRVEGRGNRSRFAYWVHTFEYLRAMGQLNCAWAVFNRAMDRIKAEKDPLQQKRMAMKEALPLRVEMVRFLSEVYCHLLVTVSNPGELGTVANWEQHIQPALLTKPGEELAKYLGRSLPPEAQLPKEYPRPPRLIVPSPISIIEPSSKPRLKALLLGSANPQTVDLYWRPFEREEFQRVPLARVNRGVYTVALPEISPGITGIEYYIRATTESGKKLDFPATAPKLNQTAVVLPEAKEVAPAR